MMMSRCGSLPSWNVCSADFEKSARRIESDRLRVALPYAEPGDVRPTADHFIDARTHELLRDAFAMELANDIQPLNLGRGIGHDAARCLVPAKLSKSDQPSLAFAEQGGSASVADLACLDRLAIAASTMELDILLGVGRRKRILERLSCNGRQARRVLQRGSSNVWHRFRVHSRSQRVHQATGGGLRCMKVRRWCQ